MAFKLPASVVRSFEDAQSNFEKLEAYVAGSLLRVIGVGNHRVAFGSVNVTASGTFVVSHGLDAVPIAVIATTFFNGGTPNIAWVIQNPSTTQFTIANPTATASAVFWLAIV